MNRLAAIPVIAVSMLAIACADTEPTKVVAVQGVAGAATVSADAAVFRTVEISARDAADRLSLGLPTGSDRNSLRQSLSAAADNAAAGQVPSTLAALQEAALLVSKIDPSGRNPDAAAIRLVINGAINSLSR